MVDREDLLLARLHVWPPVLAVRAGLVCSLRLPSVRIHLGRKRLSLSCSFSSTSRVLGSGKHVMCSAPLTQALGPGWDSIATVSRMSEPPSSSTTTCSQTHGAVISFWIGKTPLALSFFANTNFTQTLQSESFLALSLDTQNSVFSNSMKIGFFPPSNYCYCFELHKPILKLETHRQVMLICGSPL